MICLCVSIMTSNVLLIDSIDDQNDFQIAVVVVVTLALFVCLLLSTMMMMMMIIKHY